MCRRFDKLVMGALLMAKILLPLLCCSVAFASIVRRCGVPHAAVCLLVLAASSVMAVVFFFQVTGEGSWQTIGTSVSHFGIMNVQVVLVLLLQGLAQVYVGRVAGAKDKAV